METTIEMILAEAHKAEILTLEEERELILKAYNGDRKALDKVFLSCMRFIIKEAKKFRGDGSDYEDLIQQGFEGFCTAWKYLKIEHMEKGNISRFLSYAQRGIAQRIHFYLKYRSDYTISGETYNKKAVKFYQECGDNADEETKNEIGKKLGMRKSTLESLHRTSIPMIRLDAPVKKGEEDSTLIDMLQDEADTARDTVRKIDAEKALKAVESLPKDYRDIVERYFELRGKAENMREISESYGITKEAIRHRMERALKILRKTIDTK